MGDAHLEVFFANIAGIYRSVLRLRTALSERLGIKSVHLFWLYLLKEHPEGLSASALARASQTTRSLVSREITELTERGLVRTDTVSDKRRYGWRFVLTDDGHALAERIAAASLDVQQRVSRDIDREDLAVFYRVLDRLCGSLAGTKLTGGEL